MSQWFLKCEQIGSLANQSDPFHETLGNWAWEQKRFGKGEGLWEVIGPTTDTHKVPRDWQTTPANSRIQSGASPDQFRLAIWECGEFLRIQDSERHLVSINRLPGGLWNTDVTFLVSAEGFFLSSWAAVSEHWTFRKPHKTFRFLESKGVFQAVRCAQN